MPAVKRSVVDLQLTASMLASPPPGWDRVVADIAAQVAADDPPSKWMQRNPDGTLKDHGFTMRFFPQQEAAFIRARDRTCRTPNCHRPSGRCELDHREEHAKDGPSHRGCGEPRCTLHHVTRHLPGVSVTRDANGTVTYHLPNGNTHEVPEDNDIILTRDEKD